MGWLHQHPWKVALFAIVAVFEVVMVVAVRAT